MPTADDYPGPPETKFALIAYVYVAKPKKENNWKTVTVVKINLIRSKWVSILVKSGRSGEIVRKLLWQVSLLTRLQ